MSTFVSQEFVVKQLRAHQIKFWKMVDSDGKSVIAEQKDEERTVEQSVNMLEETLMDLRGKYVLLKARAKGGSKIAAGGDNTTGIFDWKILLDEKAQGVGAVKEPGSSDVTKHLTLMDQIQNLRLEMQQKEHQHQMERLQDRIKEMESEMKESNPMMDSLIAGLTKVFAGGSLSAPVASVPTTPVPQLAGTEPSNGARIKNAIIRISKIDPDVPETLEALASFAEKNPEQFLGYIKMLKSM